MSRVGATSSEPGEKHWRKSYCTHKVEKLQKRRDGRDHGIA